MKKIEIPPIYEEDIIEFVLVDPKSESSIALKMP